MAKIQGIVIELGADASGIEQALKDVNKASSATTKELGQINKALKFDPDNAVLLQQKFEVLQGSISNTTTKLEALKKAQEELNARAASGENVSAEQFRALAREIEQTEGILKGFQRQLENVDVKINAEVDTSALDKMKQQLDEVSQKAQEVGGKMKDMGAEMSASLSAPIAAFGTASVLAAGQFDNAAGQIQAALGVTAEEAEQLENVATNVWKDGFGESLEEVSNGLIRVQQNMKEIDSSEIETVTKNALALAKAFESDVNEVTRAANNLMVNFGVDADEAFDMMAKGAQNGLNFSNELFDNLAEYSGLFANMGYTVEEYFGILQRGSEAGVYNLDYLNDAMKEFQIRAKDGSDGVATAMGDLSQATQDVWDDYYYGKATVKDVATSVINDLMTMEDQTYAGMLGVELFGTKWEDLESKAMYAMLGTTEGLEGAKGAMDALTAAQEQTFGQRWESFTRSAAASLEPLGKILLDLAEQWLPKIISAVESVANWFSNLSPTVQTLSVVFGAVVAAIGPFLVIVGSIISAIGAIIPVVTSVMGSVGGFGAVLSALTGPIGIAIAAITALVAAGIALWKNWDEVSAFLKGVWEGIQSTASTVFSAIGDVFKSAWEGIKSVTETVWNGIKSFFTTIWDGIKSVFDTVINTIKSSLDTYWQSMGDGIKTAWDGIKQYFDGVWDLIKNVFVGALLVVIQLLTGKWDEAKKSTEQIWNNIKTALSNVWEGLKKVFSGALDAIKGYIKTTWDNIKSTTTSVFESVKSTISSVWEGVKNTVSSVSQNILSAVKNTFTSMASAVSEKMKEVKSTIEKWWNEALSFLKKINLTQIGKDIIQGLINGIKNMKDNAVEAITGVVDGVVDKAKSLLKIKSPSRVMMEIGRFIGDGLIVGMGQRAGAVTAEAEKISEDIIQAFKKGSFVSEAAFDKLGASSQIKEVAKLYNELLALDIQTNGQREHILEQSNAKRLQIEQKYAETFKRMEEMRQAEYAKVENGQQNSWQYANIDNSIAIRFQEELNNYTLAMQEISVQEKAYTEELNQTLSSKFDKQKQFAEKAKQLNLLSLADEKNLYDQFASLYAKDSEQFQYFNDKSVAIVEQANAKIAQLTAEYENAVNAKAQSLYSFASIFDEITYNADITGEQLLNNLASQVVAMEDWANAMQELASRGINDGLLAELEALGPKAASELMALNSLTDEQLTAYNDLWLEKSQLARSLAEEELAGMRADTEAQIAELNKITSSELDQYTDTWSENAQLVTETVSDGLSGLSSVGASAVDDLIGGLSSKQGELASVAQSLANTVTSAMNGALDINSPSGEGIAIGEFFGQGVEIGIKESSRSVASASRGLAQNIKDTVRANMWTKKEAEELTEGASSALGKGDSGGGEFDYYKELFNAEKSEIERLKKYKQLSLYDELKMYEEYMEKYAKGSEQRIEYEDKIAETKDKINEKLLSLNDDYINKIQEANKAFSEKEIELTRELAERKAEIQERASQEEFDINEEYSNKIFELKEDALQQEKDLWDEYAEAVKAREQGIYNSFGLFDQVKVSKIAGSRLIKNLETQTKALEGWKNDLANLEGRGIDKGLLEELQALGPDAAGEIKGLTRLSDKELSQYASLWKEKNELARTQANKEMQGMKADTARRVEELRSATANQLSVYQSEWSSALITVRANATNELALLHSEHNVSMETLRADTAAQLALYEQEWASSISEIRNGTKGQLNAMVSEMPAIGENIIKGMQDGLTNMTPGLLSQAQSIANSIKSTIQSALDMSATVEKVAQTTQRLSDAANNALGSLASSSTRSQAFGTSSSSTSVDNSKTFAPSVVIHTNDSGAAAMEQTLRKLQFGF